MDPNEACVQIRVVCQHLPSALYTSHHRICQLRSLGSARDQTSEAPDKRMGLRWSMASGAIERTNIKKQIVRLNFDSHT